MEERQTRYDEDFGCFFLKEKFKPEEAHDLVNRIGILEDKLEKIKKWNLQENKRKD